jgi:threonine dehydrogenase-like Zn-dependent dehydrogenase
VVSAESVVAAVQVAPETTELREFPLPEIGTDAALLHVEAAGVCGSDVGGYKRMGGGPKILGHENVGTIARAGSAFARRWGVTEGDRVAIEEYLPCGHCELCLRGEFRHCAATDVHSNPNALRYGSTPITTPPALWGGYSQYLYMPPATVLHRMPDHVPAEQSAMALPLGNGVQWAVVEGQAGPGRSLVIMGPGQQGLAAVLAARAAGADLIILTGLARDQRRLEVGRQLGASVTIVADQEDVRERVREITGGAGVDAVVDTTSAPAAEMVPLAIDLVKRKEGRIVVQSIGSTIPDFPIEKLARKYITVKAARGHSYASVELGIQWIASGRFPLDLLTTHHFGLDGIDLAIKSTGGTGLEGAIHVTVLPWQPVPATA